MAKRGKKKSMKRIAAPKAVPVYDKKIRKWIVKACPGQHGKNSAVPLEILLKDVLKVCQTHKEVKIVLSKRLIKVDGRIRAEPKFPVGLMDVLTIASKPGESDKNYRILLDKKGRLIPTEIQDDRSKEKTAKIVNKHRAHGGKIVITLHDGRNMVADNHLKVGDSVAMKIPEGKMEKHLKLQKGARCLIQNGKHVGTIATLEEIIPRAAGKPYEARVKSGKEEFITVAKYLFVVDEGFNGVER